MENNLRYERKFSLNSFRRNFVIHQIKSSKLRFYEHHQQRFVNSIYLDTDNLRSYKQNIDGLKNREKFRIRWYGEFLINGNIALEIKKKNNDLGKKIIFPLKNELNINLKQNFNINRINNILSQSDLPKNIEIILKQLKPKLLIRYRRAYFISKIYPIRITLDDMINYKKIGNNLNFSNLFEKENKQLIVELKYPPNLSPQAFNNFLDLPFRLSRNSKYVEGFNYK